MKKYKLLLIAAVLLVWAGLANARDIILTCDPYPADSLITHFIVEKDGLVWVAESTPKVLPDGSFVLWETVSGLPSGDHSFRARAVSGLDVSELSGPFEWRRRIPSLPVLIISVGD